MWQSIMKIDIAFSIRPNNLRAMRVSAHGELSRNNKTIFFFTSPKYFSYDKRR
jgi:hypothetical protein